MIEPKWRAPVSGRLYHLGNLVLILQSIIIAQSVSLSN